MQNPTPARQFTSLISRTLWIAFAAFAFSALVCGAIGVMASMLLSNSPTGLNAARQQPTDWGQWQFLFGMIGLVCVYLMHRLGRILLNPARFWQGAGSLDELGARLASQTAEGVTPGLFSDEQRREVRTKALQHLFARIVLAHIVLWAIAEVPVILGLVARFVGGGDERLFWGMFLMTGMAMFVRRPSRSVLNNILAPLGPSSEHP